MKYNIRLYFKPIFHWRCLGFLGSTGRGRGCVLPVFYGALWFSEQLLKPAGRNLLEDAQQQEIMCLYWHAWSFGHLKLQLYCWISWKPWGLKGSSLLLSVPCSFWSLCPGAVLGEGCRTGWSVGGSEAEAMLSAMGAGRMHKWEMANVTERPLPLSWMGCSSQERFPITGRG